MIFGRNVSLVIGYARYVEFSVWSCAHQNTGSMCSVPMPILKRLEGSRKPSSLPYSVKFQGPLDLRVSVIDASIQNRNTDRFLTVFAISVKYGVDHCLQVVEPLISPLGSNKDS